MLMRDIVIVIMKMMMMMMVLKIMMMMCMMFMIMITTLSCVHTHPSTCQGSSRASVDDGDEYYDDDVDDVY